MEGGTALPLESSSAAEVAVSCGSDDVGVAREKSSSKAAGAVSMDLMEVQRQQILRDLQVTIDSYNDSFRSLSLLRADVEILRQENEALWGENFELSLLLQEQQCSLLAPTHDGCGILDPTSILPQIVGDENVPPGEGIITGNERSETVGVVPKSIAVRSKGFRAVDQAPVRGGGIAEDASASGDIIPRTFQPLPLGSVQVPVVGSLFPRTLRY